MVWTTLGFGKHEGKTLPQVVFQDPDWFFWAIDNGVFNKSSATLRAEAEDLRSKAKSIKVPQNGIEKLVVEYWIHQPTKKFSHFDFVPESRPAHQGSSPTFRSNVIDMSVPRRIAAYDKTGCKSLVKSIKGLVFKSKNVKLTKDLCEGFFDDPNNFV